MPNGSDISDDEFRQLDACFSSSDNTLKRYAKTIGANYIRNYHEVPGRRIDYEADDKITRSLSFSAMLRTQDCKDAVSATATFNSGIPEYLIVVMAWKDKGGKRFLWHRELKRGPTFPSPGELTILLDEMYKLLNSISDKDLTEVVL